MTDEPTFSEADDVLADVEAPAADDVAATDDGANDILIGGAGEDLIFGGDGDDWLFGDSILTTELLQDLLTARLAGGASA
ncbi:MAG: hypothetical protein OES79_03510 [Planctomycetota bacterium]|nr:hypothetical protein [Planctomycetota bacterium]